MPIIKKGWWINVESNWTTETGDPVWCKVRKDTEEEMLKAAEKYKQHHNIKIIAFKPSHKI